MKKTTRSIIGLLLVLAFGTYPSAPARAADGIETTGTVLSVALPAVAGGLSMKFDDGEGRVQLLESTALTLAVTYGLKYSVDATRPDGGEHSFPSGHTSVSFSAADFMRQRYGWEYGAPAYLAAAFVGYSRVEADRHHVRDVVAGAAIGILSSELFTTPYRQMRVGIYGDSSSCGVTLAGSF